MRDIRQPVTNLHALVAEPAACAHRSPGLVISSSEPAHPPAACELSVVVPTYNERNNVAILIGKLAGALQGMAWELIVVDDDSPDGTADVIRQASCFDSRIHLIHRVGRRGLSSACIEGMHLSHAPLIAIMDADLQHDESKLPFMVRLLRNQSVEIVVGSRYAAGGSTGSFSAFRGALSQIGKQLSRLVSKTHLSDPMSGFFVVRRSFFTGISDRLDGRGFKILLDMLASSGRPVRVAEVGYRFRSRSQGRSKLGCKVMAQYLLMIWKKLALRRSRVDGANPPPADAQGQLVPSVAVQRPGM